MSMALLHHLHCTRRIALAFRSSSTCLYSSYSLGSGSNVRRFDYKFLPSQRKRRACNLHPFRQQMAAAAFEVPPARQSAARSKVFQETAQVGDHTFTFETGKLAQFAGGAVVVGIGDTKVLVTVVSADKLDSSRDFMPLQVEYREKSYVQGKIPNTFMRREGAPKERELLCARIIDRSVRPLFPKGYYYDTQIIANVLCSDGEQDPDVLAANAASAALTISNVPWNGPIGVVRIGRIDGKLVVNPEMDLLIKSDLNLVYSCTAERTVMIETQAREISNEDLAAALQLAHSEAMKLVAPQLRLAEKVENGKRPVEVIKVDDATLDKVRNLASEAIEAVINDPSYGKFERGKALGKAQDDVKDQLQNEGDEGSCRLLPLAFDTIKKQLVRKNIFEHGMRVDGRALDEVRELYCESGIFRTLHGSSLFSRGNTQVLCTVTLGAPEDAQNLDSVVGPPRKRFMVHYSFPPFSINETGKMGGLNRREVGHGNLAEKALVALLPPEDDDFPYSVRVTSEVLASDGSSSMATVCGGSLALMDAGIPLKEHVAGISVGLMTDVDPMTGEIQDYKILTDILGLEDHLGDMDFKIAGTRNGITAIQLDIKLPGIPLHILCEALEPAKVARTRILEFMENEINKPREIKRDDTPRRGTMAIQRESIGKLIGPQGANVKNIQRVTGVRLSIAEDGTVHIIARDQSSFSEAKEMVEALVGREIQVGCSYTGTVVAIKDFGAFVEFEGGHQGLVHISELSNAKVTSVADILTIGQQLSVLCIGRDLRGNLKFSHKATIVNAGVTLDTVEGSGAKEGSSLQDIAVPEGSQSLAMNVVELNSVTTEEKCPDAAVHENRCPDAAVCDQQELTGPTSSTSVQQKSDFQVGCPLDAAVCDQQELTGPTSSTSVQQKSDLQVGCSYTVTVKQIRKYGFVVETDAGVLGAVRLSQGMTSDTPIKVEDKIIVEYMRIGPKKRPEFKMR